jgi:hypothetical protein
MSATESESVGLTMPVVRTVAPAGALSVAVEWRGGERAGIETVDLAPLILSLKYYRPLREDRSLFETVRVGEGGASIVWGTGDTEIDMAATSVERLAGDAMTADGFSAFLRRNDLTLDAAAAHLGISRRLVAYYAKGRPIPRHVMLACAEIERRLGQGKKAVPATGSVHR